MEDHDSSMEALVSKVEKKAEQRGCDVSVNTSGGKTSISTLRTVARAKRIAPGKETPIPPMVFGTWKPSDIAVQRTEAYEKFIEEVKTRRKMVREMHLKRAPKKIPGMASIATALMYTGVLT